MKTTVYSVTDFKRDGIADDIRGQSGSALVQKFSARYRSILTPVRDFTPSTADLGAIENLYIMKYAVKDGTIYALGGKVSAPSQYGCLYRWDYTNYRFTNEFEFPSTPGAYPVMASYNSIFMGFKTNGVVWKYAAGVLDDNFAAVPAFTFAADPVHCKVDDQLYLFTDNRIHRYDSASNTFSGSIRVLPASFRIVSVSENGNFLDITGYDTTTGISTLYQWDRDSSLEVYSAKYEIGNDVVQHYAVLNLRPIIVSLAIPNGNTNFSSKYVLYISTIEGGRQRVINQYEFDYVQIGGKFIEDKRLLFTIKARTGTETTHAVAAIDDAGRMVFENILPSSMYNADYGPPTGIYKNTSAIWLAAREFGAFNTANTYTVDSTWRTRMYRAAEPHNDIVLFGATVISTPLPSGAQLIIQGRKSTADAWTTLGTFSTEGKTRHSLTKRRNVNFPKAPELQFQVLSRGGAEIVGWSVALTDIKAAPYG